MKNAPKNPANNQIGAGLNEALILEAVERSGYPLQTIVGDILGSDFFVQQEWCYADRDSKELRAIDLHARRVLYDWKDNQQPRVRPHLDLLVECKQSQLPFVFFLSGSSPAGFDHPEVVGLRDEKIQVVTDDDLSTWNISLISILDLHRDSFQQAPPYANSLSKCVRKGSEIELSGTEGYLGLVLPLIKAIQHLRIAEQPPQTFWYFDAHLVIAPMITVSIENGRPALTLTPWVRVMRHEYLEEAEKFERDHMWAVDVIHKDFLTTYLQAHALPFAQRFSERVLRHTTELATGKGFISGMNKDGWSHLEGRLRPRPTSTRVSRTKMFLKNLIRLVTHRSEG